MAGQRLWVAWWELDLLILLFVSSFESYIHWALYVRIFNEKEYLNEPEGGYLGILQGVSGFIWDYT